MGQVGQFAGVESVQSGRQFNGMDQGKVMAQGEDGVAVEGAGLDQNAGPVAPGLVADHAVFEQVGGRRGTTIPPPVADQPAVVAAETPVAPRIAQRMKEPGGAQAVGDE